MPVIAVTSPFLVNAITPFKQYRPAIEGLANGGFVISWQDESGLGSPDGSDDVRFARYDALGNRLTAAGTDTLANTATASAQSDPSVAAFADGKFVMVWTDSSGTSPDFFDRAVRGQIFNANGTKSGLEFIVNTTVSQSQDEPSVTVLTNGRFVVSWSSDNGVDGTSDIIVRVFNANGTPFTPESSPPVNEQLLGDQVSSEVHALSTGGFAVVWDDSESSLATGNQIKTFIRFYTAGGTATSSALLANSSLAGLPQEIDLAELSDGRIVVTYSDYDLNTSDGSGSSVKARIYDPVSGLFGSVIDVNTTTSNDQLDAQVAALDGGQFVVVWTDRSTSGGDTSFDAVRLQVFNSAGAKVDSEILVNIEPVSEQRNPAVAVLADGRFVVSWEDNSQTGSDIEGFAVRARIYDARIAAINVTGTTGDDSYQGTELGDILDGAAGSDKLYGGNGVDFVIGGPGLDLLFGDAGNDGLDGGADNDTLDGGTGDDTITGGPGADSLNGGANTDMASYSASAAGVTVNLTAASQTGGDAQGDVLSGIENLVGSSHSDTLTGDTLANVLTGGNGADTLNGGAGNDTIVATGAGDGADSMNGGANIDTVDYSALGAANRIIVVLNSAASSIVDVLSGTLDLIANIENVIGGAGGDDITGDGNANQLAGSSGNDTLAGGAGADTLDGGANTDTVDFSAMASLVLVHLDTGTQYAQAGTGAGGAIETDTLAAIENAITGSGADSIYGDGNANSLAGNAGNDLIESGSGADTVDAGADRDYVFSAAGADSVLGGLGDDTVYGGADNDTILGGDNNDYLYGDHGADSIDGGNGTDVLFVDSADVFVSGGAGIDYIVWQDVAVAAILDITARSADYFYGFSGADAVTAIGAAARAELHGGDGNDTLSGSAGVGSILIGDAGNDRLIGSTGIDHFVGGADADTFVFAANGGTDYIYDFQRGPDRIDMTALAGSGIHAISDLSINAAYAASGWYGYSYGTGTVWVQTGAQGSLTAPEFLFA